MTADGTHPTWSGQTFPPRASSPKRDRPHLGQHPVGNHPPSKRMSPLLKGNVVSQGTHHDAVALLTAQHLVCRGLVVTALVAGIGDDPAGTAHAMLQPAGPHPGAFQQGLVQLEQIGRERPGLGGALRNKALEFGVDLGEVMIPGRQHLANVAVKGLASLVGLLLSRFSLLDLLHDVELGILQITDAPFEVLDLVGEAAQCLVIDLAGIHRSLVALQTGPRGGKVTLDALLVCLEVEDDRLFGDKILGEALTRASKFFEFVELGKNLAIMTPTGDETVGLGQVEKFPLVLRCCLHATSCNCEPGELMATRLC